MTSILYVQAYTHTHSNTYVHMHASHPIHTQTTFEKQLGETKAWNRWQWRETAVPAGYLQVNRDGVSCLACIIKYLSIYLKPQLLTHSELSQLLQTLSEDHLPLSKHTQSRKHVSHCNHTCVDHSNHTCADPYYHTCADPSNHTCASPSNQSPATRTIFFVSHFQDWHPGGMPLLTVQPIPRTVLPSKMSPSENVPWGPARGGFQSGSQSGTSHEPSFQTL